MTERLTEEQIDILVVEAEMLTGDYRLSQALRQVREDLKVADEDAATLRGQVAELLSQRDAARERAQARIAELEAQAAAATAKIAMLKECIEAAFAEGVLSLPNEVDRNERWERRIAYGVADVEDFLANLPAAVQRHLARNRAAEDMAEALEEEHTHSERYFSPAGVLDDLREADRAGIRAYSAQLAYRAAGGEGV